jgi:thiol-disulfide isomerase/thioredoxin
MNKILFFAIITLLLFSCKPENNTIESVINDYENKIASLKSIDYDINYKIKYFSSDDTLNYNTHCVLLRNKKDTIFGGEIWIENDSIDRYYDLENIYIIEHKKEKITKYFPHKGQDWAINGNTISGVKSIYYFKPENLLKNLKDSTATHQFSDTLINDTKHYLIKYRFADELPIEQQKKNVFINSNENLISKISYSVKLQNEYQYNEWNLKKIKGNKTVSNDLKNKFQNLKEKYKLTDYIEPDKKEMEPLKNGLKSPNFKGSIFSTDKTIQLSDYKDKVVLIDFWYKGCFPCIEAIPHLSKLNTKYSKKGLVVLGLNPYDSKEKNKRKLPEVIKINKMNYPIVFVDDKVVKDYNVKVFPTLYIIDKKGKIIHSQMGFAESIMSEIDSIINKQLK